MYYLQWNPSLFALSPASILYTLSSGTDGEVEKNVSFHKAFVSVISTSSACFIN